MFKISKVLGHRWLCFRKLEAVLGVCVVSVCAMATDAPLATNCPLAGTDGTATCIVPPAEHPVNYVKRFVQDQEAIWSSPFHLRTEQLPLLFGVTAGVAALTQADTDIEKHVPTSHASLSSHASDAGVGIFAGAAATFYISGVLNGNDHLRETGILTSEAAINALTVNSLLQVGFRRARPDESGAGGFFHGGSSFPSNHSAVAWAAASVIAHEYPGWGPRLLSYGLASAVSAARVTGDKHFVSDTVVGGGLGWLIGEQIYRRRGNGSVPKENFGTFERSGESDFLPNWTHQGSSYVPLDSWVYAAFDRLSSLGYAPSGFQNMRPWTRTECSRLLQEASVADSLVNPEIEALYQALLDEFEGDTEILNGERNLRVKVEDVYTRGINISGAPLTDGFHFGQTLINDYGRPYQQGFNLITGISTHAEAGPLAFYVRGEYQHAPSAPALPESALTAISIFDGLPEQSATPFATTNRFRLLDSYVALNLGGWQASFGKQSLWWGPGTGGDLMLSNNAEPLTMLRLTNTTPFRLPSLLGLLGEIRSESFIGQLGGYHFLRLGPSFVVTGSYDHNINPQPYIWGQKLGLNLTPNLQLGVSITTVFAGMGRPLTFRTFFHSFSMSGDSQAVEPGDRRTGFDFTYRVPGLRRWLVLYNGSMSEDEPNPIAYPRRSAMNPGIYLPQIPKIQKLDLRVETGYTDLPNDPRLGVFYRNAHYEGGYTNYGQIMGSWLGPQARGYQVSSNYWQSAQSKIKFGYRKQVVDPVYVGGGTLQDFSGGYDFSLRSSMALSAGAQYERWNFPALTSRTQSNLSISMQITYRPAWFSGRH
jgi:hypothetical protein